MPEISGQQFGRRVEYGPNPKASDAHARRSGPVIPRRATNPEDYRLPRHSSDVLPKYAGRMTKLSGRAEAEAAVRGGGRRIKS